MSPMLHLTTSNAYEILKARLLSRLVQGTHDPFSPQEIIIPSIAIKRDIQLSVAQTCGIAAGMEFTFLAQWLWRCIAQLVPVSPTSPFAPERATWRLFRLLEDPELTAPFPRLTSYLKDADPVMSLELAQRIAELFERYITYRPDWLESWSQGRPARLPGATPRDRENEAWQMALWQRFTRELGTASRHPSAIFFETLESLGPEGIAQAGLPDEAHIFCLSSLPPLYLRILVQLSTWIDIHLYLINPCQDYWYELVEKKQQARKEIRGETDYLDDRYPLLADWGRQTQSLFGLILETAAETGEEEGLFHPTEHNTLLAHFQNSLLELNPPAPGNWAALAQDKQDRSVEIHAAHSLTRELEILQDQLLDRLEANPDLQPSDILVATPDLESALPLIDAVFGATSKLPYTITGHKALHSNPVARILLQMLDLAAPPCRLPATQVFALLQEPLIARSLRLDEETLEHLHQALRQAGVHWGLDAQGRQTAGLPPDPRHTWRDALGRLLLGYAMPAQQTSSFAGIIPAGNLGGSRAHSLGGLWLLLEKLEKLGTDLAQAHTANEWQAIWRSLLETWLQAHLNTPEEQQALHTVLTALDTLGEAMAEGSRDHVLPFPAARLALEQTLESQAQGGTPSGSITFTALSSLRQLPYHLVCLIGLNDGVFPKPEHPLEFDLIHLETRPGDRQRRQEDRNLFLDLILAARESLYLSYTGRSQKDDSLLPPSTLVAELLEFLCRATGAPENHFLVQHPLQPFSPLYFSEPRPDPRLTSYNTRYARILEQKQHSLPQVSAWSEDEEENTPPSNTPQPGFFTAPLDPAEILNISLSQLHTFFRHPAQALLKSRMGIKLPIVSTELEDEEPLILEGLPRYQLANRLLEPALKNSDPQQLSDLARAGPELPSGNLGEALLQSELPPLALFAQNLKTRLPDLEDNPLPFDLKIGTFHLQGQLAHWGSRGLLRYRCARATERDYLAAWLDHLCLNALSPENIQLHTTHVARNTVFHFRPVSDPLPLLKTLLELYLKGQEYPLPFYPKSAWALKTKGISQAKQTWQGNRNIPGEATDPWWSQALRGQQEPLGEAFIACTEQILTPLLQYLDDQNI